MKTITLRLLAVATALLALTASAEIPAGYYNSLDGLSGQALKDAIHNLTLKHTVFTYSSIWGYFRYTDARADDASKVWDMYSNGTFYFNGTYAASGMNKEHSFPKSWWGGGTNVGEYPSYTDINHLYPSESEANLAKSNWPLGEVSKATFDNGSCLVGTPETGQGGGANTVFEPADEYKGDFARTYFYMACCYQHYTWKYTYMLSNSDWKTLSDWAANLLCRWARADAVSDKETTRNDAVQQYQNNRNPFIDFPQLFEYIWGTKQGEVFYINEQGVDVPDTSGDPVLVAPTQNTVLDFGEVALGKSIDYVVYVKGEHLSSALSLMLYKYDYEMFSISVSSIDRVTANSADGYALTITYTPTAVGEHTARLLIFDGGITGSVGIELNARCLEAPTLTALTATAPTDITDNTFTANWDAANEEVDYYVLTRTTYDTEGNVVDVQTYTTDDANTTSMAFNDRNKQYTYTYMVQSYRLGYLSPESNVITLDASGISGVYANKPVSILSGDGFFTVKCDESLGAAVVYDLAGRVVAQVADLRSDATIYLPKGIYILRTSSSRLSTKVVVY